MTSTFSASLEHWPLDRLIPHARNAQTHSEDQVGQIAGSIAEFGFVNPILVGDDGVIVAGHGRDACPAFLDALHSRVNFRPSMTRGPIQYELDADWLAGAAGFEPLHLRIGIRHDSQLGAGDSNMRISTKG